MTQYVLSEDADRDLDGIWDIRRDNIDAACENLPTLSAQERSPVLAAGDRRAPRKRVGWGRTPFFFCYHLATCTVLGRRRCWPTPVGWGPFLYGSLS